MQTGTLGGLSAVLPHRYFADDCTLFELVFQLFRSPVFGFSAEEAKRWMARCFCEEHEGLHIAALNRARLMKALKTFFADVDYLWPVNRQMDAMGARGEISSARKQNRKTFENFWAAACS